MPTSNVNGEWQVINWSKSEADEQQLQAELRSFSEEIKGNEPRQIRSDHLSK